MKATMLHFSRFGSKCSSPVPLNAPISRRSSCECAVCFGCFAIRIDEPGSSPSLCLADHSTGILHSSFGLTAAQGCSCRYVSLSGSLAPPVISFYDMLYSASMQISTSERNRGLHSMTPGLPSKQSE
ncbi:hypothetical protein BT93_I0641 [Corymbia citriodora subsp. variegata]|nr:hypothetical protein BT93_I0641 [Corymbia citriodora subsp. variegata]